MNKNIGRIERMELEHKDLKEKIDCLGEFIYGDSSSFDSIDKNERVRLVQQYGFMKSYMKILGCRLIVAREQLLYRLLQAQAQR